MDSVSPKLNIAPENGRLEEDPFMLCPGNFSNCRGVYVLYCFVTVFAPAKFSLPHFSKRRQCVRWVFPQAWREDIFRYFWHQGLRGITESNTGTHYLWIRCFGPPQSQLVNFGRKKLRFRKMTGQFAPRYMIREWFGHVKKGTSFDA